MLTWLGHVSHRQFRGFDPLIVWGTINNRLRGEMVGEEGFEPPTLWSQTRCATRLRYSPIKIEIRALHGNTPEGAQLHDPTRPCKLSIVFFVEFLHHLDVAAPMA